MTNQYPVILGFLGQLRDRFYSAPSPPDLVNHNDNYRGWDWDLMPGTVNYWDWLEMLLVYDEVGYQGWLVSDVYPARMDPVDSLSASYQNIIYAEKMLDLI